LPYAGPIYIDDVMPILERMKTSKIFYSGVIPKIDLLDHDIRGLRTSSTSKVPGEGPVSDAVNEILTVLDRVRWITTRYRRGLIEPKLGEELLQIWPLFIELYNMVLHASAYGSDSSLQNRASEYIAKLHDVAVKEGLH
jgi:hypothetical protein